MAKSGEKGGYMGGQASEGWGGAGGWGGGGGLPQGGKAMLGALPLCCGWSDHRPSQRPQMCS